MNASSCLRRILLSTLMLVLAPATEACAQARDDWIEANLAQFVDLYKHLHANPELSFAESKTAAHLAGILRELGYEVTTGVGGHGVVAILANGEGQTAMFRSDMDALPVTEDTGLPYASKITATNEDGETVGVMHACGHDIHMTNLIGLATFLVQHKSQWQGAAMLVLQPAEERALGARAMLDDGLFTRFPKPDYALGMHVATGAPTNVVQIAPGAVFAAVNMVDITCYGRGGHGAYPHDAIDPIAQAATLVVDLQAIVSREISPTAPAVVTVGSIHGGTKHNIIPDSCRLQLTVRNYSEPVRKQLLDAIERKANAVAASYRAPKPPLVEVLNEWTPPLVNNPQLTRRIRQAFIRAVGAENIGRIRPQMGGEDFAFYGQAGAPACYFRVGSIAPERHAKMKAAGLALPAAHSAKYYPDPEPTLRTGLTASIAAMLDLLQVGP